MLAVKSSFITIIAHNWCYINWYCSIQLSLLEELLAAYEAPPISNSALGFYKALVSDLLY